MLNRVSLACYRSKVEAILYLLDGGLTSDSIKQTTTDNHEVAMSKDELQRSNYSNGDALNREVKSKLTIDIPNEEVVSDSELTNEKEDVVEHSIKPVTLKEHATQDTLNFVYKNSWGTSPSHAGGSFPLFSGGTGFSITSGRSNGSQRRPSGIPPPARALKPGDFLYKKTLNTRRHSDMAEAQEEEEKLEEEQEKEEENNAT